MLSDQFAKTFRQEQRQALDAHLPNGGATLPSEIREQLLKAEMHLIQWINEARWRLVVAPN